jgi:hypothetical protein
MESAAETRLEWERLLTGHHVQSEDLPRQLRELLLELDQKLGVEAKDRPGAAARQAPDPKERIIPPAGPHARPDLINRDLTPGTGMLPDPESDDPNMQPSS